MSVDFLLAFVLCQAAFVQPDGITLPFTFLTYKSLPTNPKESLMSLENSGNAETLIKTDDFKEIKINSSKTSPELPLQQSLLKSIIPTNSKNAPFRTNSLDAQTKPREQIESSIKIQSSSPSIATTQVSKLPPIKLLSEGSNIIKNDSISCTNSPKTSPFTTTANNFANNRNNNIVNLRSSLHKGFNDVPYSTYTENQVNIKPKYLDCNEEMNHGVFEEIPRNSLNPFIQKLEKTKVVPGWENIQRDNLNKIKDNIAGSDVVNNLLPTVNRQKHIDKNTSCNEKIKLMEKPNKKSKVLYPVDNIVFNSGSNLANSNQVINAIQAETAGEKRYNNSNFTYTENNVELIVTPSVKFRSDKVNAIPCNVEIGDSENINNVAIAEPMCSLNYAPSQTPLRKIYFYGGKEMPKVYLPSGYTNTPKTAISLSGSNVSPTSSSSIYKVSDTYNCVKDKTIPEIVTKSSVNVQNLNPNNCVVSKYLVGIDSPNIIPTISTYYSTPSHTKVPDLSQLPGVYPPEVTFSQPLSSHIVSNPTNVLRHDVPEICCVNSLDNRFPTSIRSNVDHTMLRSSENLNLVIPLFENINHIYPPCQPKCIHENYVKPSTYVFTPVKNNQQNLQPPEYVSPVTLPLSPAHIPCPSKSKVTKTNLYRSPLTESLNNIISYFTTGLLSAFFGLNTKSDEVIIPTLTDCPVIASIENDVPSSIHSETSISVAMPIFMLNPPQLPSPTSLPIPNVLPLKDCDNKLLSIKRKPVVKKPKAYISSITLNLIPSNDVDDIIVFV